MSKRGPDLKPRKRRDLLERFWSCVDKNGTVVRPELGPCWLWKGPFGRKGYGRFWRDHRHFVSASKFAYEQENGPLPDGHEACHHCDNPPCIRPAHLFPGTHADNEADKKAKGRQAKGATHGRYTKPERNARGEHHGLAKLTAAKVAEIRAAYVPWLVSQRKLAKAYGVSQPVIGRILRGELWKETSL